MRFSENVGQGDYENYFLLKFKQILVSLKK